MKLFISTLAMLIAPILANAEAAAPTSQQLAEANAVIASKEIKAILDVEKKLHNLKCENEVASDVTITHDSNGDSFEVVYGCNDATRGANVQRLHFSGVVYVDQTKSKAATPEIILTTMMIELSE